MSRPKSTLTIRDVAETAGVSVSTVSRVLNDKDDVAAETYEKVQRVIADLGYASSLAATGMRSRRTNVIGVLVIDMSDPFSLELVKGVGRAIRNTEYELIVYSSGHVTSNTEPGWERRHLVRLNGSITDGMIVATPTTSDLASVSPLVVVDPHVNGTLPAVSATNQEGAIALTEYLIALGHRRIGFVGGRTELLSGQQRLHGYQEALCRANLPIEMELIQEGDYTPEAGSRCAYVFLSLPHPPTAIFAANDQSALGVMDAAKALGLRIPEDLSVVGFDNIPQAAFVTPALTTVDQSIDEMGYAAANMLLKLIQGESLDHQCHKVLTKLIVRDSCQPLK
ncbi:MAG: LacI family DNA-binding transcriptional regulator [Anaerolineae bacterium]|nr:LacI family DNA-binding transcriptional regulator [Anaerolineae bacterium]